MSSDLVFLHGVGGSADIWEPQVSYFAPNCRVLAWNAPGYGGTPQLAEPSFASLGAKLAGDMADYGLEQAVIVGHSFGGMVAQQLVRDHPGLVVALVLSGTSPAFGNPDGRFQQTFVASRTKPLNEGKSMADVAKAVAPSLIGSRAPARALDLAVSCMSAVPEDTYRAVVALLTTFDLRNCLADISTPTLLIAGSEDTTARPEMMERMAGRIPGARFETIDGAGHLAPLEQPAEFNQLIETFIAEKVERP